jgi:hypothetical protein
MQPKAKDWIFSPAKAQEFSFGRFSLIGVGGEGVGDNDFAKTYDRLGAMSRDVLVEVLVERVTTGQISGH